MPLLRACQALFPSVASGIQYSSNTSSLLLRALHFPLSVDIRGLRVRHSSSNDGGISPSTLFALGCCYGNGGLLVGFLHHSLEVTRHKLFSPDIPHG